MRLRAGIVKRLHVNQHAIRQDRKAGTRSPAVTVQTSRGPHRGFTATILGKSCLVYRPERPLSCGARLWIETRAEVELV